MVGGLFALAYERGDLGGQLLVAGGEGGELGGLPCICRRAGSICRRAGGVLNRQELHGGHQGLRRTVMTEEYLVKVQIFDGGCDSLFIDFCDRLGEYLLNFLGYEPNLGLVLFSLGDGRDVGKTAQRESLDCAVTYGEIGGLNILFYITI